MSNEWAGNSAWFKWSLICIGCTAFAYVLADAFLGWMAIEMWGLPL